MAARVGVPVTGTADGAAASIATSAKSTTTGNALWAFVKWEDGGTLSSVTDTAGNTWTIQSQGALIAGTTPAYAIAYCQNITGNASNVVTANFSGATATWRRIISGEVSGLGTAGLDGTPTSNSGTGLSFTTGSITTTTTGFAVYGVAGFTSWTTKSDASTPAFNFYSSLSDTLAGDLESASAQVLAPAASATGGTTFTWKMAALAFKDDSAVLAIDESGWYATQPQTNPLAVSTWG